MTSEKRAPASGAGSDDVRHRRNAPLRDALWSVYHHTTFRPRHGSSILPKELRPIPLSKALGILLGENQNLRPGESDAPLSAWQRRAFEKLAAAGFYEPEQSDILPPAGEAQELRERLGGLAEAVGVASTGLLPDWDRDDAICRACLCGKTLKTTVTAALKVGRPLDDLAKVIDPLSWSEWGSAVFEKTCRVDEGKKGEYQELPTDRKSLGLPWTGLLREKVAIGPVVFDNVLRITFTVKRAKKTQPPSVVAIFLQYELYDTLGTELPLSDITGTLQLDDGWTRATPDPADPSCTLLSMEKTVRFKDLTKGGGIWDQGELMNYLAPATLTLWVDAATNMERAR